MGIVKRLDAAVQDAESSSPARSHLGASSIGGRCGRQAWYGFRQVYKVKHGGRILRLFSRGHEEEFRFNKYLRQAGAEVRDYSQRLIYHDGREEVGDSYQLLDWDEEIPGYWEDVSYSAHHIQLATELDKGPKQWGFIDHGGHFAGSSDGKISWPGVLPDGWGLLEEKTSNEKSFNLMVAKGVLTSKPVHYVQMQVYMHYLGLPWALYLMVNKNDDRMYAEVIYYKPEVAMNYVELAGKIITAIEPPRKITNDPSWFECKFCDFREVCHYDKEPAPSCRSCKYVRAVEGPSWYCELHHAEIPIDFVSKGCDQRESI